MNQQTDYPLLKCLESGDFSDLTLIVGPHKITIKVHQIILCSRSAFFKAACTREFREKKEKLIRIPEITVEVMKIILKWMYYGGYSLPEEEGEISEKTEPADGHKVNKTQHDLIILTYDAVSFLGMPLLEDEITSAIEEDIMTVSRKQKPSIKAMGRLIEDLNSMEDGRHRAKTDLIARRLKGKLNASGLRNVTHEASADSFWAKLCYFQLQRSNS